MEEEIVMNLLSELWTFVGGAASMLLILTWIGKTIIEKKVDRNFTERIEKHRHDLQMIADKENFDYQKRIHSFTLYASERHAIYPALYKQILFAHNKVLSLRGLRTLLTFEEFNKEDIENYMVQRELPHGVKAEILELWDTEHQYISIRKLRDYLNMLEKQEAEYELHKCRGKYYENELFLSEEVSIKIGEFLGKLLDLNLRYQYPEDNEHAENTTIIRDLETLLEDIKIKMQEELSLN